MPSNPRAAAAPTIEPKEPTPRPGRFAHMITITISAAAYAAMWAALSPDSGALPARPDGKGGLLVTLDRHVVDRLAAMRAPGESYSDVILRIASQRS